MVRLYRYFFYWKLRKSVIYLSFVRSAFVLVRKMVIFNATVSVVYFIEVNAVTSRRFRRVKR